MNGGCKLGNGKGERRLASENLTKFKNAKKVRHISMKKKSSTHCQSSVGY